MELGKLVSAFNSSHVEQAVLEDLNDAYKVHIPKYAPSDLFDIAKNIE
jgi:hypothetical protein